jgi:hypothetical protein
LATTKAEIIGKPMTVAREFYSVQALFQALQKNIFGQFNADEHHFAHPVLISPPLGSQVAAHELVHTLKDDFAIGAFHVEHPFVAQHARAIHIDHGAQEIFELGRVKSPIGFENKTLDIVIVVVMVPVPMVVRGVIAVLTMLVVVRGVVTVLPMMVVVIVIIRQKVRVDVEFGVQVETAQIKHLGNRHIAKMHRSLGRPWIHVLEPMLQCIELGVADQIGFGDEDLIGKAHLPACLLSVIELLGRMFGIDQGQNRIQQIALGHLIVHEKSLGDRARVSQTRGLDDHAIKIEFAFAFFGGQLLQGGAQVFSNGATDTTVAHLNDLFLGLGDQNVIVDVLFSELVFNDSDFLAMGFRQDTLEQGGFA